MKPFEVAITHLPFRAGKAQIRWSSSEGPRREEKEIVLPLVNAMDFIPLQDGLQFVCRFPGSSRYGGQVWFGGTDENPFLVRLQESEGLKRILARVEKGEEAPFYEALKPPKMKKLASYLEEEPHRQGDIFALPIDYSWQEIAKMQWLFEIPMRVIDPEQSDNKEIPLFGTRHTLIGKLTTVGLPREVSNSNSYRSIVQEDVATIASGVITAPDHRPLELDGIHALFQSEMLYQPQHAD